MTSPFSKRQICTAMLVLLSVCGVQTQTNAQRVEVFSDDFEGLPLGPFTLDYSSPYFLDGTDYTKTFPPGWVLDNSGNLYNNATMPPEFDGWSLMDVPSWIGHAEIQDGRDRCLFGNTETRNVALVADPDEADDDGNSDLAGQDYNSYISRTYDVGGRDLASLEVSFDYDFETEDTQTGVVDISFDGGSTWQNLLEIDSTDYGNSTTFTTNGVGPATFTAGVDFTSDLAAAEVVLRFGCIRAGNDWWFCIDNVGIADVEGEIAFEDFEDSADDMVPFDAVNGGPTEPFDPSDGTDWINPPAWTVSNDGTPDLPTKQMYRTSQEGAAQGWTAVDANSWFLQQDDQQRGFFNFPVNNTVLLADGDWHADDLVEDEDGPPEGEQQYNSFIEQTIDMSGYDNTTTRIEFNWETRLEGSQRGFVQVSFDYGLNWVTILDVDSSRLGLDGEDGPPVEPDYEATFLPFLFNDNNGNGFADADGGDLLNTFTGPQQFNFGDEFSPLPAKRSNTLTIRFGYSAGNNWWFAVDDVKVSAETQAFVMGDATGDGIVNFDDIDGFAGALFGAASYDPRFDFCADGLINFDDIDGFAAELFN